MYNKVNNESLTDLTYRQMNPQQVTTKFSPKRLLHRAAELNLEFAEHQSELLIALMTHHLVDKLLRSASSTFTWGGVFHIKDLSLNPNY